MQESCGGGGRPKVDAKQSNSKMIGWFVFNRGECQIKVWEEGGGGELSKGLLTLSLALSFSLFLIMVFVVLSLIFV